MNLVLLFSQQLVIKLIRLYQKTLSFDHGILAQFYPNGYCQYHPTCSEYAIQSIDKHGLFKGSRLGLWRIIRCNPFSKGGIDLVN